MRNDLSNKEDMRDLLPVIVGGDVGAYALGLEFFEAYGAKSLCVSPAPVDAITKSEIFDIEQLPAGASDEVRLAVLKGIARSNPDKRLVYLANTDMGAAFATNYREQLLQDYVVPFPSRAAFEKLCLKDSFDEVCAQVGVRTPETVVADFANGVPKVDVPFAYPVVAKTASGDAYDRLHFEGKKKIWFIDTPAELDALWVTLESAGYRDKFLVQEHIPGDDSQMRSLTMYVDSHGSITLLAAAQVLLQDPSPKMIGNPVAMITEQYPQMWDAAQKILAVGGYNGFANFDIKIDPRDGSPVFLEVNPRIGRNSYYVVGSGANPMEIMTRDLVLNEEVAQVVGAEKTLYSLVPIKLIYKYLESDDLKEEVRTLVNEGRVVSPLESPVETSQWRKVVLALQKVNYWRKFRTYFRQNAQES